MIMHARNESRYGKGRSGLLEAVVIAGVCLVASSAAAEPTLLTFEELTPMSNSPAYIVPLAARLSDDYLQSNGIRFHSGSPFVAVVLHGDNSPSGKHVVVGTSTDGRMSYLYLFPVEASFFDPTGTTKYVVDSFSVRGDMNSLSFEVKTLEAYDVNGNLLASDTQPDFNLAPLTVTAPGIHNVRMYSQNATVAFDNFMFDTPRLPTSCPGDLNGDTVIDDADFVVFASAYNVLDCADPAMPSGCPADLNVDGIVDDSDFSFFVVAYDAVLCP